MLHTRHCCWPGAANGGDGAGGAAGAAGGDGGGPALVLACNCMEDAAGAARLEEALQALLAMLGLKRVPIDSSQAQESIDIFEIS